MSGSRLNTEQTDAEKHFQADQEDVVTGEVASYLIQLSTFPGKPPLTRQFALTTQLHFLREGGFGFGKSQLCKIRTIN